MRHTALECLEGRRLLSRALPSISISSGGSFGQTTGIAEVNFGSVAGVVFNDLNANGARDAGEAGLANRIVYVDANSNNALDPNERRATTNASGEYVLGEVTAGTYPVRQVLTSGTQTTPGADGSLVTFVAGQRATLNFGVGGIVAAAVVEGRVFRDANNNGAVDAGEPGQANVRVYLDYNNDGLRQDGEPQVLTNATGNYRLEADRSGSFSLRLNLVSSDFVQTLPAGNGGRIVTLTNGRAVNAEPFAVRLREAPVSAVVEGRVIRDANGNGIIDAGEVGAANVAVYLDYNNDGARQDGEPQVLTNTTGGYRLVSNRVGSVVIRLNLSSTNWIQSFPAGNAGRTVTLTNGQAANAEPFAVRLREAPVSAVVEGRVIRDANGNGIIDPGEVGAANVAVYLDYNNDGARQDGEPQTLTNATGGYRLVANRTGSVTVRLNLTGNFVQTLPAGNAGRTVGLVNGQAVNVEPFGVRLREEPVNAVAEGRVINDRNGNGAVDEGEPGVADIRVYLDFNNNARRDDGEPVVLTNVNGNYRLVSPRAGAAVVRLGIEPRQWIQTLPADGGRPVTLAAGSGVSVLPFGIRRAVEIRDATIAGTVFADADRDGRRDAGEAGVANAVVFIDSNSNGRLDSNERSRTTGSDGKYRFLKVRPGDVSVRIVASTRQTLSLPATGFHSIRAKADRVYGDRDFATLA